MAEQVKLTGRAIGGPYDGRQLSYRKGERMPMRIREGDRIRRDCHYQWTGKAWRFVKPA